MFPREHLRPHAPDRRRTSCRERSRGNIRGHVMNSIMFLQEHFGDFELKPTGRSWEHNGEVFPQEHCGKLWLRFSWKYSIKLICAMLSHYLLVYL